jgi:outer membrane immunogenic protein
MTKSRLLTSVSALILSTGMAVAADIPVAPKKSSQQDFSLSERPLAPIIPVTETAFSWTGPYAGLNVGYGGYGFLSENEYKNGKGEALDAGKKKTLSLSGLSGGILLGYLHHFDPLFPVAAGVELDLAYTGFMGGKLKAAKDATNMDDKADMSSMLFATARAKVGFTFERVLFYATGGVGFDYGLEAKSIVADGQTAKVSKAENLMNSLGWVVGGGVEFAMMDNLSIKVEYLFKKNFSNIEGFAGDDADLKGLINSDNTKDVLKPSAHIVRAGVNFRFN